MGAAHPFTTATKILFFQKNTVVHQLKFFDLRLNLFCFTQHAHQKQLLALRLKTLKSLALAARMIGPIIVRLPFSMLYPTGERQGENKPRQVKYFLENDIIAGDFHFIRQYMPLELPGKIIITNTVTKDDIGFLKERGVKTLITTTPEMEGRSFGTNILEALLIALAGGKGELSREQYDQMLADLNFTPRIVELQ
jgi:hypothetical protein